MLTDTVTADDGFGIAAMIWESVAQPVGIVQIAHGMAEHCQRYAPLAEALNANGYLVIAHDHRGHGHTADGHQLGHFADADGWRIALSDIGCVAKYMMARHAGLPRFLLGHSMGSLLARNFAIEHSGDLAGLVLSGTAGDPGFIGKIGRFLARTEVRLRGPRARSRLMNTLTFGAFNVRFRPNRTPFDWLSRDPAQVDRYIADPLCGAVPSAQFFVDMTGGVAVINDPSQVAMIRRDLPVLLISGDQDPVGEQGKGVQKVRDAFLAAGLSDVSMKLYPGARHEIFNETNADEVVTDLVTWLNAHVRPSS